MRTIKYLLAFIVMQVVVSAISAANIRVYINPGHGSWGPNCRPQATIPYPALSSGRPDTLGFYESNTNLWKALALEEKLLAAGGFDVKLSRRANGPYPYAGYEDKTYNKALTTVCAEAEAYNADYYISIHSNAGPIGNANGTSNFANYPVILYRGYTGSPKVTNSDKMAKASMARLYEIFYTKAKDPSAGGGPEFTTYYSPTNPDIVGDLSFYNTISTYGYLGALKHAIPGFLSEGYFHTYSPARHRALNTDWCRQEGVRYYRGIMDYYGKSKESVGYIMGYVRSKTEKLTNDPLYLPHNVSNDVYLPINGAKIVLRNSSGQIVKTNCYPYVKRMLRDQLYYITDNNYNGVFVFENLAPGTYTISVHASGYADYTGTLTVKADATTYTEVFMSIGLGTEPNVSDAVGGGGGNIVSENIEMEQNYINQSISNLLTGKTIRRAVYGNGIMYILAVDANKEPTLFAINTENHTLIAELPTNHCSVVSADGYKLSDIALTSDGVLIGCNMEHVTFTPANKWKLYQWTNNGGTWTGTEWIAHANNETAGNYYDAMVGSTFAYTGSSASGKLVTTAQNIADANKTIRFVLYTITNNAVSTVIRNQPAGVSIATYGDKLRFATSLLGSDRFVLSSSTHEAVEWQLVNETKATPTLVATSTFNTYDANYFTYSGSTLMATPKRDANGNNIGIALYNISSGINNASLIETSNTNLIASAPNYSMAAADVNEEIITLYLLKDNSLSKFTKAEEQPIVPHVCAYNLNVTQDGSNYIFTFDANSVARGANIIFYDQATGDEVGNIELGKIQEGNNSFTIAAKDLPGIHDQVLTWALDMNGYSISEVALIKEDKSLIAIGTSRLFNAVNTNPESEKFGHIYIMHRAGGSNSGLTANSGIWELNYELTKQHATHYRGGQTFGNPTRIGIDQEGYLYISDWSDGHSGIWIANTANLTQNFTNFFAGNRENSGAINNGGIYTGSSTPGCYVYGEGKYTKLYVYNEDEAGTLPQNGVVAYNIGQQDGSITRQWATAPSTVYPLLGSIGGDIPTNAVLWEIFETAYCTYYGVNINKDNYSVSTGNVTNFLYTGKANHAVDVSALMTDNTSEFKWLGDYIQTINGAPITQEVNWRFSIAAFFMADAGNPSYNVDFTTAGQPSAWGDAYRIAHQASASEEGNPWATSHGFFCSHVRGTGADNTYMPELVFYDNNGNKQLSSNEAPYSGIIDGSNAAGFAVSPDESMLVLNDGSQNFLVFDIEWAGDKPTLTVRYKYHHGVDQIRQMNWDYAGNLICSGNAGIHIFALPTADNQTIVPARKSLTVTCKNGIGIKVSQITLNHSSLRMGAGETQTLTATVTPDEATIKTVTWKSINTNIATVTSTGIVTAVAKGETDIIVTTDDGGHTDTCHVSVYSYMSDAEAERIWAYDLRLTSNQDNHTFTFKSVADATEAYLVFFNQSGAEVGRYALDNVQQGAYSITLNEADIPCENTQLNWGIELHADAIKENETLVEITDQSTDKYRFYLPQGVAVDNNPESNHFGQIYIAAATSGDNADSNRESKQKAGLFVYDPLLEEQNPTNNVGIIPSNVTFNTNSLTTDDARNTARQQMHRIAVDPVTHQVAFAYYLNSATGAYAMNPENLSGAATNLVNGFGDITRVNALCFDKEGVLYVMNNANYVNDAATGRIYKIKDGIATLFSQAYGWASFDNAIVSDGRGGLWVAQYRSNFDGIVALSHINANGEGDFYINSTTNNTLLETYTSGGTTNASYRGQVAYNEREDILAFGGGRVVQLFKVSYDANGVPTLTKFTKTVPIASSYKTNIDGIAFDYAGDLYVASAWSERFYKFAVPTENNVCLVPAQKSQVIDKRLNLRDTEDNSNILNVELDKTTNVRVFRSLTAGMYNTLCLPFDLATLDGTALEGAELLELDEVEVTETETTQDIRILFTEADGLTAGKPYLIQPTNDITQPLEFDDVVITTTEGSVMGSSIVTFNGILSPKTFYEGDKSSLFLTSNNILAWPNVTANMNGMRAYFQLTEAEESRPMQVSARISVDRGSTTEDIIVLPPTDSQETATKIMRNGIIYILRNGEIYTLQGTKLK